MSKFGLMDEPDPPSASNPSLTERIASFATVKPRSVMDLAAVDAAAAPLGFVSREVEAVPAPRMLPSGRRRRAIPSEPTRHLAIRLTESGYGRFVAYADRKQLTYHDALMELMDAAGE